VLDYSVAHPQLGHRWAEVTVLCYIYMGDVCVWHVWVLGDIAVATQLLGGGPHAGFRAQHVPWRLQAIFPLMHLNLLDRVELLVNISGTWHWRLECSVRCVGGCR
jgi:hypothetical protein